MAAEDELWRFDVQSVTRVVPAPDDDSGAVTFSVVFDVTGPDANAEIEVYVTDVPDPSVLITLAMAHLHHALDQWTRITSGRRIANDDQK